MDAAEQDIPSGGRWLRPDREALGSFWDVFVRPGETHEVRVPKTRKGAARLFGTVAAYFNNREAFVREAARLTGLDAQAVYLTLNPVKPDLRARADNRLVSNIAATSTDNDVIWRRHFLVDCDPTRPSETSATDAERDEALAVRDAVCDYLTDLGWPAPVSKLMSGNGGGLVYRVDLANTPENTDLIEGCLATIGALFGTATVEIDQTVANPSRLTKVPGTVAAKGDDCPDGGRRWRVAAATLSPDAGVVPRELREGLPAIGQSDPPGAPPAGERPH